MIYLFLFFCLLLIYSLMLCFGDIKYFCIHIPHNSSTTPLACIWNIIFYDALHLCSSTRPSFLCKNFQIYAGFFYFFWTHEENIFSFFFFSHFLFISMWGHIDPEDQKCKLFFYFFFYIPSEQPNQAQFFCVYRWIINEKSQNLIPLRWREPFF